MSAVEAVPDPDRPEVYDLNATIAEREQRAPFRFKFGPDVYTLPPSIDVRAVAALTAGRADDGLRMLLGSDQWDRLQQVEMVFDEEALTDLFKAYGEHLGEDLTGESPGSTRSSKSTGSPSKRTSRGSTKRA